MLGPIPQNEPVQKVLHDAYLAIRTILGTTSALYRKHQARQKIEQTFQEMGRVLQALSPFSKEKGLRDIQKRVCALQELGSLYQTATPRNVSDSLRQLKEKVDDLKQALISPRREVFFASLRIQEVLAELEVLVSSLTPEKSEKSAQSTE